jgi:hypothetical protein
MPYRHGNCSDLSSLSLRVLVLVVAETIIALFVMLTAVLAVSCSS